MADPLQAISPEGGELTIKQTHRVAIGAVLFALVLFVSACGGSSSPPSPAKGLNASIAKANENKKNAYVQVNGLDFRNYNARQEITDNPATIMWCTLYPPNTGQEPITLAFAGKVTSSTKTPYPPYYIHDRGQYNFTQDPLPSGDGMYGQSDPYQYGLDPSGVILDQFNFQNYNCTTAPTTYMANSTKIAIAYDPTLMDISLRASALITKAGKEKGAQRQADLKAAGALLRSAGKAVGQK